MTFVFAGLLTQSWIAYPGTGVFGPVVWAYTAINTCGLLGNVRNETLAASLESVTARGIRSSVRSWGSVAMKALANLHRQHGSQRTDTFALPQGLVQMRDDTARWVRTPVVIACTCRIRCEP